MRTLDSALLTKVLSLAADRLSGEWVLLGGTLLPALGVDVRSTVDIDLVGLGPTEAAQSVELMEIAEQLGLPVETINQAAGFFLRRIQWSREDLILMRETARAKIYRPSLKLYWQLKLERLSESDVVDCRSYFQICRATGDPIPNADLEALVASRIQVEENPEKLQRLEDLLDTLSTSVRGV